MSSRRDALGRGARAFRALHTLIAVVQIAALGNIWKAAITRRRGPLLVASVATLAVEGVALIVGRGDCPLGPLQAKLGDPVPLFELVLPPRAAKAAVPVLTGIALAGIAVVAAQATPRPLTGPYGRRTKTPASTPSPSTAPPRRGSPASATPR